MHKRFGHANIESIVKGLLKDTMSLSNEAVPASLNYLMENATAVFTVNIIYHLFPNASTVKGSGPGKYVVCDIQGPFSIKSMGGERYVFTYTDYYTRYSWTYLLHQKSEVFKYLKHLVEVVFKAARVELRYYHSDGAGELTSKETTDYLQRTVGATMSTSEA
jgi:hypothetical protein